MNDIIFGYPIMVFTYVVTGGITLNERNAFQKGLFDESDCFPTNCKQYSFDVRSKFLLTALPICAK